MDGLTETLLTYNYSPRQWGLLRYLVENGEATLSEVAAAWHIEKPTLTPVAHNLMERGIIEVRSGSDKRQKIMAVTVLGQEQYATIQQNVGPYVDSLFDGMDDSMLSSLEDGLTHIYRNIKKEG